MVVCVCVCDGDFCNHGLSVLLMAHPSIRALVVGEAYGSACPSKVASRVPSNGFVEHVPCCMMPDVNAALERALVHTKDDGAQESDCSDIAGVIGF